MRVIYCRLQTARGSSLRTSRTKVDARFKRKGSEAEAEGEEKKRKRELAESSAAAAEA